MKIDYNYITDRFIKYCEMDTRSYPDNDAVPTSPGQVELLMELKAELSRLGLEEVSYSAKDAYLVGKIPATTKYQQLALLLMLIQQITIVKILKLKFIQIMPEMI